MEKLTDRTQRSGKYIKFMAYAAAADSFEHGRHDPFCAHRSYRKPDLFPFKGQPKCGQKPFPSP